MLPTRLIYVPRALAQEVWRQSWQELAAMADRQERGVRWATDDEGYALMREGLSSDRALVGRALLYYQGWTIGLPQEPESTK